MKRNLQESKSLRREIIYEGNGVCRVMKGGRLVERLQLEKGDNLLEALEGKRLQESMSTKEIKEYIKDELDWQREASSSMGGFTKGDRDEVITGTLINLEDEGKITHDQYEEMIKFYKVR